VPVKVDLNRVDRHLPKVVFRVYSGVFVSNPTSIHLHTLARTGRLPRGVGISRFLYTDVLSGRRLFEGRDALEDYFNRWRKVFRAHSRGTSILPAPKIARATLA
jgi:hypothetical protein